MPREVGSFRIELRGTMASGATRWACGLSFSKGDDTGAQSLAAVVSGRFEGNGFYSQLQNNMSDSDRIIELTAFKYGAGGGTVDTGRVTVDRTGSSGTYHPKATAAVLTLRTNLASRSGRGRMYTPATGIAIASTGLIGVAALQALVDGLYDLVEDPIEQGYKLQVFSPTDGVSRDVVTVDADRIPDRQEHRERGLTAGRVFPS